MDNSASFLLLGIIGGIVNFLAIVHYFNKLEHRLTRTETHVLHILNKLSLKIRESDLELGGSKNE